MESHFDKIYSQFCQFLFSSSGTLRSCATSEWLRSENAWTLLCTFVSESWRSLGQSLGSRNQSRPFYKYRVWLGLTDMELEGQFRFVTNNYLITWANWKNDEPQGDVDDAPGLNDCVLRDTGDGTWKIKDCDGEQKHFYCERVGGRKWVQQSSQICTLEHKNQFLATKTSQLELKEWTWLWLGGEFWDCRVVGWCDGKLVVFWGRGPLFDGCVVG